MRSFIVWGRVHGSFFVSESNERVPRVASSFNSQDGLVRWADPKGVDGSGYGGK
jgi:hypothetical protein